mmetsp:Transcript_28208/g.49263  ORF Transcript_28208/g.49263 Transcript_28208/m.49263 type:complete len:314 (+) Transcript_28208:80-1021(+)
MASETSLKNGLLGSPHSVTREGCRKQRLLQVLLPGIAICGVAFATSWIQHWWDTQRSGLAASPVASSISQQVLIVLDMQKDYDRSANLQLYDGKVLSPYASDISSIVPTINKVRGSRSWDKVIWTQDWLSAADLIAEQEHPFCVADTPGAELLDGLDVNPSTDFFYSKKLDDAFNIVPSAVYCGGSAPNSSGPRHGYGLRDEGLKIGAPSNALIDILRFWGFSRENTSITIAGQMTDRCVMKTALHAQSLGYQVVVEREAVYTNQEKPDYKWHFRPPVPFSAELQAEVLLSHAGPGRELAFQFFESAGVHVRR